jgi:hypothetical protein
MSLHRTALARVLAVLALLVGFVALLAVVTGSLDGDENGREGRPARQQQANRDRERGSSERPKIPRTYVVQPGDSLSAIADRTGVPQERIEALNPGIDDLTLQIGAELKLR